MILTRSNQDLYSEYKRYMHKIADVKNASAVLQWDQETYLPAKGAAARGQQIATLSETAHEWLTSPAFGNLLTELNTRDGLAEDERRNIALSLEDYTKQKKFSPEFIRLLSETASR